MKMIKMIMLKMMMNEYDHDGPAYVMFTPINTRISCRWTE